MSGKKFRLKVIILLLLSLFLTLPLNSISTLATETFSSNSSRKLKKINSPYTYIPPKNRKKIKARAVGMGSRGCNKANLVNAGLRLFIPKDHVGLTISGRPTFFWYISTTSPIKVSFTLIDPDRIEPIINVQKEVRKTGIEKLQLPLNVPELEQGKSYRWTVSLICNEKKPSQNINAYSWIERVAQSTSLKEQLKFGNTPHEAIYAQEGIWFDTLTEAFKYNSTPQNLISLVDKFNRN